MNRTRRHGGLCVLVLMALVLVAVPAVPATADHAPPPGTPVAGSGTLHGTELVQDEDFLGQPCFRATKHIFGLQGEGTYSGRTAEGQEVIYRAQLAEGQPMHEGPLEVTVENTEAFHHGPHGTHGSDSSCSVATAGAPVPATFTIFAAGHVYKLDDTGAQVPCTGTGTWVRKGGWDQENWHADWTLDQDCTVVGNEAGTPGEGIAPAYTAHTHRGIHVPCGGSCVDNFKLDYAQYPPMEGLSVALGGPAWASIGQTVTVTAGVADDGAPLAGAAVAFSVEGPAPSEPPAATAPTGTDGRASFTFTAAVEGNYVVTASATSANYPGAVVSDTHTVRFSVPAPTMTVEGPTRSQTEDPVEVAATIVDENNPVPGDPQHDPVPGVPVDFTVTGPGQANPTSGTAVTDLNGRATFTFIGDRAGDYTVTASATYPTQLLSAIHSVRLDVKTLSRLGAIALELGEGNLRSAVVDPAGDYAYFATNGIPSEVVKVDLATFERVGAITLTGSERDFTSAVVDPAGNFAYFGTGLGVNPARVVKVDLKTFQRVGAITLAEGEKQLFSAVIDPTSNYAYFGTHGTPGRVVKVDLNTFERVGAVTLAQGENQLLSGVIDPAGDYAYFGVRGAPGRVVKVDLNTFQRVGAVTLAVGEDDLSSAVIDPAGNYAYFGTHGIFDTRVVKRIVKVDLSTLQRMAAIDLPADVSQPASAVIDPAGNFAYFGATITSNDVRFSYFSEGYLTTLAGLNAHGVLKVDLNAFELAHVVPLASGERNLTSAVIAPDGSHAYFGTDTDPGQVVKLSLTRPPNPALAVADDTYATDYLTPLEVPPPGVLDNDGTGLTAHNASDPAGGSVDLRPDGSFTYTPDEGFSGVDTFTYTASDGMDYSAPATVSVAVGAAPEGVSSVGGGGLGYFTRVSLFGGPFEPRGPDPVVTLPSAGSATPITASSPSASAVYGPATLFESGALDVSTSGTTGSGGSSTASASVLDVGPGPLYGASMASTCTSNEDASTGDATLSGTRVVVSMGADWDSEADDVVVQIPDDPAPNTEVHGAIENVGDYFRVVFNEQIPGPDAMTVNAAHMYLEGPTAIGEVVIGQSRCAVAASVPNEAPTAGDDAYSTGADTPLTIELPGVLANDSDPEGQALTAAKLVPAFPASPSANWSFPSDPANGTLVLNDDDGSFTYTPDQGFVGTDSFPYRVADQRGATDDGTVSITVEAAAAIKAPPADFDGDGDSDRSVFRKGAWYAEGQPPVFFGVSGDIPVPGDYNGDGTIDRAVYRKGAWYIQGQPTVFLGNATDVPVPGDYDGNGTTEPAVYRNGAWYIAGQPTVFLGNASDIPVPGDYDGDGDTEAAVYRNGAWYVHGQAPVFHGVSGDIPVPGDYDGNGSTDRAVYRKGAWYVAGQPNAFLGNATDVPVPGDYDANGSTDRAVYRSGAWYVAGQPNAFLGVKGDIPLPLPHAVYRAFF